MQPAGGHQAGAEAFSVGDAQIRLWASVWLGTVFFAVAMGAPASLHHGLGPIPVAAGQGLVDFAPSLNGVNIAYVNQTPSSPWEPDNAQRLHCAATNWG